MASFWSNPYSKNSRTTPASREDDVAASSSVKQQLSWPTTEKENEPRRLFADERTQERHSSSNSNTDDPWDIDDSAFYEIQIPGEETIHSIGHSRTNRNEETDGQELNGNQESERQESNDQPTERTSFDVLVSTPSSKKRNLSTGTMTSRKKTRLKSASPAPGQQTLTQQYAHHFPILGENETTLEQDNSPDGTVENNSVKANSFHEDCNEETGDESEDELDDAALLESLQSMTQGWNVNQLEKDEDDGLDTKLDTCDGSDEKHQLHTDKHQQLEYDYQYLGQKRTFKVGDAWRSDQAGHEQHIHY